MSFYDGKNVLVAGGTGLIGRPLVDMLVERGAKVTVVSMDYHIAKANDKVSYQRYDLRNREACLFIMRGADAVFNLVGVKGSPSTTLKRPATFFVPTLQTQTNLMDVAQSLGIQHYLHTSTVGVYPPASIFREDDVWLGFPSPNDRFAGWAKRMGEMQAEAYAIEHGWKCSIVRPANVYGPYDNFNPATAMVLPSLIARVVNGENPLIVWGDGSGVRDFVHASDVARGMLMAVEQGIHEPLNLGSGVGVTIRQIAALLAAHAPGAPEGALDIVWDNTKPKGDDVRLMDISRARSYGYVPQVGLADGIRDTMKWLVENKETAHERYIAFDEKR